MKDEKFSRLRKELYAVEVLLGILIYILLTTKIL